MELFLRTDNPANIKKYGTFKTSATVILKEKHRAYFRYLCYPPAIFSCTVPIQLYNQQVLMSQDSPVFHTIESVKLPFNLLFEKQIGTIDVDERI